MATNPTTWCAPPARAGAPARAAGIADANPGWPRLRVGVNSGVAVVREMGGHGFVDYVVVGDTVNTASRLEARRRRVAC